MDFDFSSLKLVIKNLWFIIVIVFVLIMRFKNKNNYNIDKLSISEMLKISLLSTNEAQNLERYNNFFIWELKNYYVLAYKTKEGIIYDVASLAAKMDIDGKDLMIMLIEYGAKEKVFVNNLYIENVLCFKYKEQAEQFYQKQIYSRYVMAKLVGVV